MDRLIVITGFLFIFLLALEIAYGLITKRNTYRLNDSISSISQGVLSQIVGICTPLFQIGLYTLIFPLIAVWQPHHFYNQWYGFILAMILFDFCDYWLHRVSHQSAIFWAAHVVHHQSQCFNFSTALRQESFYPIVGWFFYLPMAVAGVPPEQYAIAGFVVLAYQFWIHTEHIGKLGWLDKVLTTPSNHRVHHAINDRYINKNYGAMLIIWDRLFGTFIEENEDEPCIYGTKEPLNSWNPIWSIISVFYGLCVKAGQTKSWKNKFLVFLKAPDWQPYNHKNVVDDQNSNSQALYNPGMTLFQKVAACILLSFVILGDVVFTWYADDLSAMIKISVLIFNLLGLWMIGMMMSPKTNRI